jgi:DNA-binding NtrC family response regulator
MDRKVSILILDDEEIVCTRLKPTLEKAGYFVETFTDSRQVKELLDRRRFDILITDLKMPYIDGMQLFDIAKKKWPDIEVIIITGFATIDVTREALRAGVHDVIAKPFRISQLKDSIDKIARELNGTVDAGDE